MKETITSALEKVAAKVSDSSPEGVRRIVMRNREELNAAMLIAKLLSFDGKCVADLCQHLGARNASVPQQTHVGRTQKLTLDDLERRGGALYSNVGNKHEFNRK